MEENEEKKIIKQVYKAIVSIKPPQQGPEFVKKLYNEIISIGQNSGFNVKETQPFEPIKYYTEKLFCAQIEIQFGSKRENYRTIYSLLNSGALVGVYITSSKSRGLPLPQIGNFLSRSEGKTNKFIVYDIETRKHIIINVDSAYDKTFLFHPVSIFSGPKKYNKGYVKKKRKRIYGRKS